MQSNNPVFRRSEEFNRANAYGNQTHAGAGGSTVGFGDAPVGTPTHVRYAWADAPYVNLYSADDLPAVPFELPIRAN
jgi:sialate O-acetylesterase